MFHAAEKDYIITLIYTYDCDTSHHEQSRWWFFCTSTAGCLTEFLQVCIARCSFENLNACGCHKRYINKLVIILLFLAIIQWIMALGTTGLLIDNKA